MTPARGAAGRRTPRDRGLFDREHELDVAGSVLEAARSRRGSVVVVRGAPGSGRSALLDAIGDRAAGFLVLRAHGATAEQSFPFGVVQQLLQPLVAAPGFARWEQGAAELAHGLLVDEPWSVAHQPSGPLLHGLHTLLRNVSDELPVLLIVDDLQWVDEGSRRFLDYLAKRLNNAPIQLVYAVTDGVEGDLAVGAFRTLSLRPLSADGISAMVANALGPGVATDLAGQVHAVSRGNPGAATAVLSALRAGHPLQAAAQLAADQMESLLGPWRLAILRIAPGAARELAQAMAVLGRDADPDLLLALTGLDEFDLDTAFVALERLGLAAPPERPGARPWLVHPSLATAVLGALPGDHRRKLHRHAAIALYIAGSDADRVAEHLVPAGAGAAPWGADLLRTAAGAAMERGDARRAAQFLQQALLDVPESGPYRATVLVELAVARRDVDPIFAARQIAAAVPELAPGPERATAVLRIPVAIAAAQRSLRRLIRDTAEELTAYDTDGGHTELARRMEARVRWLDLQNPERIAESITRLAEVDPDRLVTTGGGRELLTVLTGAAAVAAGRSAPEVGRLVELILRHEPADPAHVVTTLPVLMQSAVAADTVDSLEAWLDRTAAAPGPARPAGVRAALAAERAFLHAGTGRLARARQLSDEAVALAGTDWPEALILAVTARSVVALQTRDARLAADTLSLLDLVDDVRTVVGERMLRGLIASVNGDLTGALDGFLDAGWQLNRAGWTGVGGPPWRLWAAAVRRRIGDVEAARQLVEDELAAAEAWGGPTARGRALRMLGALTPGEAGITMQETAVTVLHDSADRLELARATVALARRLRDDHRPGAAALLAEGERLARAVGASWTEEGGQVTVPGPVPRLLRSGRDRLTPAEVAVVDLVMRGWANGRIAEELGVTRRAVEKNLTQVYRKLGVAGRTALVREFGAAVEDGA
ncbi:MAG: AAA family ATPase [Actinomycetota bacterium]|nr:AAA family ATPase [Actinomycetota bacterium]